MVKNELGGSETMSEFVAIIVHNYAGDMSGGNGGNEDPDYDTGNFSRMSNGNSGIFSTAEMGGGNSGNFVPEAFPIELGTRVTALALAGRENEDGGEY